MLCRILLWSYLVLDLLGGFCFFFNWFNFITRNHPSCYLFFPAWTFRDYTFLGIYPFLLGCPFYWCLTVHSYLLWPFVFLRYWLWLFFFHVWLYLGILLSSIFAMILPEGLLILFFFTNNQLLVRWSFKLFT